jgi:exonuclease-1
MEDIGVIVAPYEADAQLAYLSQNKLVDIVVTQDSDLIVFGCEKVS